MSRVTVGEENSAPIEIYCEDHGTGRPVVLVNGFPLSGASWEKQVAILLAAGYRVITYDRRGFGQSSQPSVGYDYDTLAADLNKLIKHLDLWDVSLVGFSMGTGEVTRYLGTYGSNRVEKVVLIAPLPPFLLKTNDNPEGVDQSVFDALADRFIADRPAALAAFLADFYNVDVLGGTRVSTAAVQASFTVAVTASALGTVECIATWQDDFRGDLPRIDVPTLIIQGDADRILPPASTGNRLPSMILGSRLVVVPNGPTALPWTHADALNPELLAFLK